MGYDALLLLALIFVAAVPVAVLSHAHVGHWTLRWGMRGYVALVGFAFFGWFWTHGGQTLGMRAWQIRVTHADGTALTWRTAALRYVAASVSLLAAGLGYWWSLIDRERLTWHDRLARTRVAYWPRSRHASQQIPGEQQKQ